MRFNFRVGWFRIEILPKFKIIFDVRRTINKKAKKGTDYTKRGQVQARKAQAQQKKMNAQFKKQSRKALGNKPIKQKKIK